MVVGIPCMANTHIKINKVYLNVITTLAALWLTIGEPQTGPALRWISADKETSVGPVTSGVHLLDRQVRDAHSVRMAPRMILSCPTSLWLEISGRHSNQRNAQRPRWVSGAISGRP